jgi:hypothetical protein
MDFRSDDVCHPNIRTPRYAVTASRSEKLLSLRFCTASRKMLLSGWNGAGVSSMPQTPSTGINLLCPINQVPDQSFLPPCEKTAMWNALVTGVLDEIGNAVNTTG